MSGTSPGSVVFDVNAFLDRPKFGAYRILIFALCTLVMTVDGYDVFVVGYVVPALAQDFGVPLPAVTSIFVFQTIGLGLGAYAVSPFADRFGRRNIILICTALLGVLTLAGTFATSVGELAVLRFVASFFFGAVVPNLVALSSRYCSRRRRTIHEETSGAIPMIALFRDGRTPTTLLLWLSYAMNLFVLTFIASWMPTFLRVFAGVELKQAGAIAALFSLGGIVSPLLLGYFIDRHGATRVLAANYLAAGVSIILIGLWSGDAMLAAIGVFCAGLFVIGGQGGINALAAMLYPTEMRATGVGWALGAGRLASVVGPS